MTVLSYPTILAGQDLTADLLNSMIPVVSLKTSDTSRISTTTATNDPELLFSVAANATYVMDGWLKYDSASAAAINIDWNAPSGSLGEWQGMGVGLTATSTTAGNLIRMDTNDLTNARSFGAVGVGVIITMSIHGTLRTGSTAGTYALSWAQATSTASDTTIYTDSWLRLQRIA